MLSKLVTSGDIIEKPDKEDARTKRLSLSAAGRRRVAAIHAFARAQVAAGGDQQADRQVGHVLGQCPQRRGDGQPTLAAVGEVDGIGADAVDRDHLHVGQLLERGPRDAGMATRDDGRDGGAVFAKPGRGVGLFVEPVHGVERREPLVGIGDQDGIELEDLGFRIVIYGISLLMRSVKTMMASLEDLRSGELRLVGSGVGFEDYKRIVGFDRWAALERRYGG